MKKITSITLLVFLCICISGCSAQKGLASTEGVKYTLYIGLNDKDTYTQRIPYEEAQKKASNIALKYVDGFTVLSAKGMYKDEKGVITTENSLVFEFTSADDQQIKNIMDEIIKELNQNSVLVEKKKVKYEFYEGISK